MNELRDLTVLQLLPFCFGTCNLEGGGTLMSEYQAGPTLLISTFT